METTIDVALTLTQLEVIADALEFTGQCCEEELKEHAEGSEEHRELSEDLNEITEVLGKIADAMEEITGESEEA